MGHTDRLLKAAPPHGKLENYKYKHLSKRFLQHYVILSFNVIKSVCHLIFRVISVTHTMSRQPTGQRQHFRLTLFVLDFSLDILDSIRRFNLETPWDKTDESDTFFRPEYLITRLVDKTLANSSVLNINL